MYFHIQIKVIKFKTCSQITQVVNCLTSSETLVSGYIQKICM